MTMKNRMNMNQSQNKISGRPDFDSRHSGRHCCGGSLYCCPADESKLAAEVRGSAESDWYDL